MVLGMPLHAFTLLHVVITLVELVAGVVTVLELMAGNLSRLSGLFLLTAALTSITGFLFPIHGWTPGLVLGVLSLVTTGLAALALYARKLAGGWRRTYAIAVVVTLYFDAFVAVVQSFAKIGPLHMAAPTGKELPFALTQGLVLLAFVLAGVLTAKRFSASGPEAA